LLGTKWFQHELMRIRLFQKFYQEFWGSQNHRFQYTDKESLKVDLSFN
jgi:hypothetical protein